MFLIKWIRCHDLIVFRPINIIVILNLFIIQSNFHFQPLLYLPVVNFIQFILPKTLVVYLYLSTFTDYHLFQALYFDFKLTLSFIHYFVKLVSFIDFTVLLDLNDLN